MPPEASDQEEGEVLSGAGHPLDELGAQLDELEAALKDGDIDAAREALASVREAYDACLAEGAGEPGEEEEGEEEAPSTTSSRYSKTL